MTAKWDLFPNAWSVEALNVTTKPFDVSDGPMGWAAHIERRRPVWEALTVEEKRFPEVLVPLHPARPDGMAMLALDEIHQTLAQAFEGHVFGVHHQGSLAPFVTEALEPLRLDVWATIDVYLAQARWSPSYLAIRKTTYVAPVGWAEPLLAAMIRAEVSLMVGNYPPGTGSLAMRLAQADEGLSMMPNEMCDAMVRLSPRDAFVNTRDTLGLLLLPGEAEAERLVRTVDEMRAKHERGGRP